jgi:hypothetical protein
MWLYFAPLQEMPIRFVFTLNGRVTGDGIERGTAESS